MRDEAAGSVRLIVFAKAPRPGLAKTRLIPALGPEGAAALAQRMLHHALGAAVASGLGPVELCAAPDASDPLLQQAAEAQGASLAAQGEGDLGARMDRALMRHLGDAGVLGALLIGTDAPALDAVRLREAAQALRDGHDAVFVPALDGGYALVGLRRADPRVFAGMRWSHDRVMHDTRTRLAAAGLRWAELAPVADIDEPPDLVHLPEDWQAAFCRDPQLLTRTDS
jgi:rSAM/selenodomain-associated transferase 1